MATFRKRGTKWHVQVRRKGSPPVTKSFLSKKDGEIWSRQIELQADRRELQHDPRLLKNFTLADLVVRYRDTVTPLKRSPKVETIVLNAFLRHPICLKRMSEITVADFSAYRDERLQEVKPRSLQRMLSPIQNLFEIAKSEWGLPLRENPVSKLKYSLDSNRRERRLRTGELEGLLEAVKKTQNPHVLPMVLLALQTALRRSELLAATWAALDLERRSLTIPESKNGHSRTIPLTREAVELLESLPTTRERIFPLSVNAFRLSWERLVKRAGIEDLHFHDLRHEAISRFFELGLSAPEVALISGHRDMRMLFRYTHPTRQRILLQLDGAMR